MSRIIVLNTLLVASFLCIGTLAQASEGKRIVEDLFENTMDEITTKNTGGSPGLQSSGAVLNDLLPNFQLSLNGTDVSDDGTLQKIGFTYSPKIDKYADIGLTVTLERPDVFAGFKENQLITNEQEDELENELTLSDRVTTELTFSYIGKLFGMNYGRSVGLYEREFERLFDVAFASIDQSSRFMARDEFNVALRSFVQKPECRAYADAFRTASNDATLAGVDISREELIGAINGVAPDRLSLFADCKALALEAVDPKFEFNLQSDKLIKTLNTKLDGAKFKNLAAMINQQPQLQLSASYTSQDDTAGTDEFAVSLKWEMGLGQNSLNDLVRSKVWRECQAGILGHNACFSAMENQMETFTGKEQKATDWRFALSGEWKRRKDHRVMLDDPVLIFSIDGENTVEIAASFSATKWMNKTDLEPYVFELSAGYQSNDSDMMNDRTLLSLTGTRNLARGLALSFGVVWASRPEFRGDVDQELTAKLGFNYKLTPLKK